MRLAHAQLTAATPGVPLVAGLKDSAALMSYYQPSRGNGSQRMLTNCSQLARCAPLDLLPFQVFTRFRGWIVGHELAIGSPGLHDNPLFPAWGGPQLPKRLRLW